MQMWTSSSYATTAPSCNKIIMLPLNNLKLKSTGRKHNLEEAIVEITNNSVRIFITGNAILNKYV